MLRLARETDLPSLLSLESVAFGSDRISARQFRRFIQHGRNQVWVVEGELGLEGYAILLLHRGTHLARIYSLAVDPRARGRGVATQLIRACEQLAIDGGYIDIRLEVRLDNLAAQRLYQRLGYRPLKLLFCYYDDDAAGMRMFKRLEPARPPQWVAAPFYAQTTPFSCGPACLLMAMSHLAPRVVASRRTELALWREATTIFMTDGHGGCSPQGLALAAWHRGFEVTLWVSQTEPAFLAGVRSEGKREVMRLVHDDFCEQLGHTGVSIVHHRPTLDELAPILSEGIPIIALISCYRLTGDKAPHWVLVVGINDYYVWFHDPDLNVQRDMLASHAYIPVRRDEFARMMVYGKERYSAALCLRPRPDQPAN